MYRKLEEIKKRAESGIESMDKILENKKSSSIQKNRASYILNVLEMFLKLADEGIEETNRTENVYKTKADQWDQLEQKIAKFYPEEYDQGEDGGDLCDIGEIAARAFGYL